MNRKNKILLATAAFCLTLGMSVVSVGCKGSYEMTDFVVDGSSIELEYEVGALVDLSALKMYALYSDDSKDNVEIGEVRVYLGEEDITDNLFKITETAGEKTVVIKYETEYGSVSRNLPTIKVKEKTPDTPIEPIEPELVEISEFNKPQFLAEYQAALTNATNDATAENFESVFFKNDVDYYVVGDDNAFIFLPRATSIDFEAETEVPLENFTASTTVKMLVEGEYKLLERKSTAVKNEYEYYDGSTLFLTEKADENEYLFTAAAQDNVFLLSVLPDASVYTYAEDSIDPVEIEVKVTDGFNVYNVQQLCVLDNSKETDWAAIKGSLGLLNVDPNAVILHGNMKITEAEVPESMKYTLSEDYKLYYKDGATEKVGTPEEFGLGRTFLWDKLRSDDYAIYRHYIPQNGTFAIYGNYFELDASKLPLVASFEAAGVDGATWYDVDFSNTTLLQIYGESKVEEGQDEKFFFYNLAVRGNAKGDQLVVDSSTTGVKGETLVYGGSIIFVKVQDATAVLENVRAYTFFIPFFANSGTVIEYNRTKCYDSFQNAIYAWAKTDVTVKNSYFQRAGGPLIIMVHKQPDKADPLARLPQMNVDENSVLESYLTGSEIWFSSVKATTVVDQIKSLDTIFRQFGKTILKDGKLNVVALLMSDTYNAEEALTDVTVQGKFTYKDAYLDRMDNATYGLPEESNPIKKILAAGAPAFNVGNNILYLNDKYQPQFLDPSLKQIVLAAFADPTAEHVVMNMGGIGLVLGYGNVQTQTVA